MLACAAALVTPANMLAQGITASSLSGQITSEDGKPVAGATVKVVHVPTNSVAEGVTSATGRFSFSGVRVGGPYVISAEATGYTIQQLSDIYAALGQTTEIYLVGKATSETDVVELSELRIVAAPTDLNPAAAGAGSVLDNRGIVNMPTSNRSFADMMKTNPFVSIRAGSQVTALGMNNRYNSISIDGARLNDQFGLAASGLFSLKNPFALDALETFSIQLTPYDVTQSGFAGASINAVSKSGTNEFHGSLYYIYTSSKWQGADVFGTTKGRRPTTFWDRTWGATLGGPILKNKLFFFLNYEKVNNPSGGTRVPGFQPDSTVLNNLTSQFASLPGSPDFGTFGSISGALVEDEKKLVKLDWNITNDHRMTVRYSETEGNQPFYPDYRTSGAPSSMPTISPAPSYANGVTTFNSKHYTLAVSEKVWAAQLFSSWSPNFTTELSVSKNDTTSLRATPVNLPEIVLLNVPGTSVATGAAVTDSTALLFGTDYSSMGNGVISETFAFSGNGTYTWNDFTFRAGFDREETDFENLFRNGSYGRFVYNYVDGFNLGTATPIAFVRNVSTEGFPGTDISKFEQTGLFAQAKWSPTQRFNVMFGLRYDRLGSPIDPPFNPAFETAFGVRNDATIDGSDLLAPRLSFNYALDQERTVQLRGGVGLFLGRNPWVWMSNSYGNAGFGRFTRTFTSGVRPTLNQYLAGTFDSTDPVFTFDPENPRGTTTATTGGGDVAFMQPDLKLPTNWRGNLALDMKVSRLDANFSVEYIHTEVKEAVFYNQINLVPGGTGADGRTYFRRYTSTSNPTLIPLGTASPSGSTVNTYNTSFNRVFRFGNTDVGRTQYLAFSLDRPIKDRWGYTVTYTRGKATEAQPGGSSTASSQWAFNVVFNQNTVEETRSDYEVRDRLQVNFTREFTFLDRYKTTATLYYEGRSGLPYSYVYSGDLNFDGSSQNDTVAVPTDAEDPRFNFTGMTAAQRDAYIAFMQNSELSRYVGGYAPRNAFIGPWQNRLDLHLSQEVKVVGDVHVEVFADFINFGSWVNKDVFNYVETLGNPTNSNQLRVLGNATYGPDGRIRPSVSLDADGNIVFPTNSQFLPNNGDSRWRIQAGVRLKF